MYSQPLEPPPGPHYAPPSHPTPNADNEDNTPTYAPPPYPPPLSDPTPSSSHPIHPAYVPPPNSSAPPQWETSAGELRVAQLYPYGIYHDAGHDNFQRGIRFCEMHPDIDIAQFITYKQLDLIR